ncbi:MULTISPECIES: hypothetical protein [Wolbachia]|uniref:Uncharacterized protein n=1 Tax=Wolbachia pipientis TaxID=955 RepID=A0A7G5CD77_WOLPI|nr:MULTISPECIES: hypothetical protein [Wolbachia]MDE5061242.1 hypothetical protein [Wolbachia endosymbiont of Drosophila nikananu]QMV47161.1 hypothetical protein HC356_03850 [Wolbachia pipientis]
MVLRLSKVSFQRVTLESRKLNFTLGNKNWIPVSGHWDDKNKKATRMTS